MSGYTRPRPIGDILSGLAAEDPDRPAITCGGRTITRGELESRANRLARAYAEFGVRHGDFVTVALPNGIEFYAACYAVWKLGAVPQPASWRLPGPELARLLALADPALVVGVAAEQAGGRASVPAGFEPDGALSAASLESRVSPSWKATTSGGSTGVPKLIVAGRTGALDPGAMMRPFRMRRGQVQLVPGPLYHNAPFMTAMGGTFLGQHLVVLPKFDAQAALEAITQHQVNYVGLVPTMMLRILRILDTRPGAYDLSSMETVFHTAAPCPPWLKERWIDIVGADRLYEGYGGTEGQAFTIISGADWLTHRGSVGRPVAGEITVIGPDKKPVAPAVVGEVVMRRSSGSPPGYRYIGAEARVYDGGWESLGDLGWLDEDGYLYLADRVTDMLLVGGANVYPAEVEAAILEHPAVLSCAVVGLPDDDLGQLVHAVVQVDGTQREGLTDVSLRDFVEQRLVRYKVPRSFRFVTRPLRDDAGKIRRSTVRDREIRLRRPGTDSAPEPPEGGQR
jgi:bile acid-coenzyme A ligase